MTASDMIVRINENLETKRYFTLVCSSSALETGIELVQALYAQYQTAHPEDRFKVIGEGFDEPVPGLVLVLQTKLEDFDRDAVAQLISDNLPAPYQRVADHLLATKDDLVLVLSDSALESEEELRAKLSQIFGEGSTRIITSPQDLPPCGWEIGDVQDDSGRTARSA